LLSDFRNLAGRDASEGEDDASVRVSQHSTPRVERRPAPTSDSDSEAGDRDGSLQQAQQKAAAPTVSQQAGRKKAKAHIRDVLEDDEAPPPAAKKHKTEGNSAVKKKQAAAEEGAESDSEDDQKSNNNRYKSVKCSDILSGQVVDKDVIAKIRHHFQMAMIARDGMDLQDGAANRALNFHQVLRSARDAGLNKDYTKKFCNAMTTARAAGREDQ